MTVSPMASSAVLLQPDQLLVQPEQRRVAQRLLGLLEQLDLETPATLHESAESSDVA